MLDGVLLAKTAFPELTLISKSLASKEPLPELVLKTDSLYVTDKLVLSADIAILVNVGIIPSITIALFAPNELVSPGEGSGKTGAFDNKSFIVPPFKLNEVVS